MTGDSRRREDGDRERTAGDNGSGNRDSPPNARERLIDAFTKVAAERGFRETTVEDVAALAEVPDHAFYAHFANLRQCLGAAHDAYFERLVAETTAAIDPRKDWPTRVREAVGAVIDFVDETLSRSRFFAVEAAVAGPLVLERQSAALGRIVPLLREGREQSPAAAELPELIEPLLIGGAAFLIQDSLLAERELRSQGLESEVVEILLTPYVGRREARRIAG